MTSIMRNILHGLEIVVHFPSLAAFYLVDKISDSIRSRKNKKHAMLDADIDQTMRLSILEQRYLDRFPYRGRVDFYREVRNKQRRRLNYLIKLLEKRGSIDDLIVASEIRDSGRIYDDGTFVD